MSRRDFSDLARHLVLAIVLVSLLTLLIPVSVVKADSVVTFPDANLKAAIWEAVGKPLPVGDIYESDLSGLTTLSAASRGIVDLTGLEYCTALTTLDLEANQTDNLTPLSGLTSLTTLVLESNEIVDITPLSGLGNLTYLELNYNQISDISPVAGLTKLTTLYLHGNHTDNLTPLSGLTSLTTLGLDSNKISDLEPLSGLANLQRLGLDGNRISNLTPLSALANLEDLRMSYNQIDDISPVASLTKLMTLLLVGNQTDNLTPLDGLTSLTGLYLNGNQISDISPLSSLGNLTTLDLNSNKISDLSPLSGLGNLTYLELNNNKISDLLPLSGLTGLMYLELDNNQIGDLSPLSSLNLGHLRLENNQIGDLLPLSGLTSLTTLDLGSNQIGDLLPLSVLTSLMYLELDNNQIGDLSPLSSLDLEYLRLENNQISDIEPLADNPGIASGDSVNLTGNPLNSESVQTWIPALRGRGVIVSWDTVNQPPNQPSNVSPGNAAPDVSLMPTLQSSTFSDNDTGDIHAATQWQITTVSGEYSSPAFDSGADAVNLQYTAVPSGFLTPRTEYYWHVRYQDSRGDWSSWSVETSFETVVFPPPTLTYPADGTTTSDNTPWLDWSDVSGDTPIHYQLQVDDNADFSSLVVSKTWVSLSSTTLPDLPQGVYYWRVRAVDDVGNPSDWSGAWSLTVTPAAPALVYPANWTKTKDNTPWLDWSDVSGDTPIHYQLQVDDNDDFSSPAVYKTSLSLSSTTLPVLPDGVYYWRVRAVNAAGIASNWSGARFFRVDTVAPLVPTLIYPVNGKVTNDNTPWLDWSDVSDVTGVRYQLQVDDNADFSSLVVNKASVSLSSTTLPVLPDGGYYWRVRAVDGVGNASDWSGAWTITVDTAAPPMPTLSYPADGTATSDNTPWLDWTDVTDATGVHYQLQVDDNADFSSPVVNKTWVSLSSTNLAMLPDGVYYWMVRAVDAAGNASDRTSAWSFTVATQTP